VSVLFADVAAFTTFAETAPPERVVAFLNELFSILAEVVFRHGGTVDKFIGDSIMALFGAPDDAPDHVERALAAAEDMHRFVEANAPAWRASYGVEVRLGIGVSTGAALVGNLGSERRMEYTAIGDVVNVAARLEYLAEPGKTLVTDEVRTRAERGFDFVSLGEHRLRGKQTPVAVWEVA
jgi:class 3 adenylate cyclase